MPRWHWEHFKNENRDSKKVVLIFFRSSPTFSFTDGVEKNFKCNSVWQLFDEACEKATREREKEEVESGGAQRKSVFPEWGWVEIQNKIKWIKKSVAINLVFFRSESEEKKKKTNTKKFASTPGTNFYLFNPIGEGERLKPKLSSSSLQGSTTRSVGCWALLICVGCKALLMCVVCWALLMSVGCWALLVCVVCWAVMMCVGYWALPVCIGCWALQSWKNEFRVTVMAYSI